MKSAGLCLSYFFVIGVSYLQSVFPDAFLFNYPFDTKKQ